MNEYRVCKKCDVHHYENCYSCFGYGVRLASELPISAIEAEMLRQIHGANLYSKACPECGSTYQGLPETVKA